MRMEVIALDQAGFQQWVDQQLQPASNPEEGDDSLAAQGWEVFASMCSRCHQVNGLVNHAGEPIIAQPEINVYNGGPQPPRT